MRGLSMVNSYSIIVMGWGYVRYGAFLGPG